MRCQPVLCLCVLQCVTNLCCACVCCNALPTCAVSVCVAMRYQPVLCLCASPCITSLCVSPCIVNLCIALCVLQWTCAARVAWAWKTLSCCECWALGPMARSFSHARSPARTRASCTPSNSWRKHPSCTSPRPQSTPSQRDRCWSLYETPPSWSLCTMPFRPTPSLTWSWVSGIYIIICPSFCLCACKSCCLSSWSDLIVCGWGDIKIQKLSVSLSLSPPPPPTSLMKGDGWANIKIQSLSLCLCLSVCLSLCLSLSLCVSLPLSLCVRVKQIFWLNLNYKYNPCKNKVFEFEFSLSLSLCSWVLSLTRSLSPRVELSSTAGTGSDLLTLTKTRTKLNSFCILYLVMHPQHFLVSNSGYLSSMSLLLRQQYLQVLGNSHWRA